MMTAAAVANDRVSTVHDGSAEYAHKPNDSQLQLVVEVYLPSFPSRKL